MHVLAKQCGGAWPHRHSIIDAGAMISMFACILACINGCGAHPVAHHS